MASPERPNSIKSVYVARTTKLPQPEFEYFLSRLRRRLRQRAIIKRTERTHVTFLESYGVRSAFEESGATQEDVEDFSADLSTRLHRAGHYAVEASERVNPDSPLIWTRSSSDITTVALNLLPSERILDQRGIIEEAVNEKFGEPPRVRPFCPHISIGLLVSGWLPNNLSELSDGGSYDDFYSLSVLTNPESERVDKQVLSSKLLPPSEITLNGLSVFIGRIHSGKSLVLSA